MTSPSRAAGLGSFAVLAAFSMGLLGCSKDDPATVSTDNVAITVSPLQLAGITNASYRLTVTTGTDTVWTADIDADSYGDGQGAISYVGPCDASAGVNTVSLTLLSLSDADGTVDPLTYVNPTKDGPLTQDVLCVKNADRPVTFNITVMRDARQGFFDVAVNFEDIFCSAKVDCDDITLVARPGSGERLSSAVMGLACTGGLGADTHLYMTDVVVKCGSLMIPLPVGNGPGNLYGSNGGPAPLAQAMTFVGAEQLAEGGTSYGKVYFNVALGIDFTALAAADYPSGCTLSFRATASDGPLDDCTTPADTAYPVLAVDDLPFISAGGGGFACGTHPLGSAGFVTRYTPNDTPQAFGSEISLDSGTGAVTVTACDPQPVVATVSVSGVVHDDVNGNGVYDAGTDTPVPGVTVSFSPDLSPGANLLYVAPPWSSVSDAQGAYLVDNLPMGVPLCKTVTGANIHDFQQCGITITPVSVPVISSNIVAKAGCVVISANDATCDAIDDDCDGYYDEDANPLACDPCLSNTDCCSGICTAGVCTGAPLAYVVAALDVDGPADLPGDYECITEVTTTLNISPNPINGPMPAMNWASLQQVGNIIWGPSSSWDVSHHPVLTTAGSAQIYALGPDSSISVPALASVTDNLDLWGHDLTVSFPALTTVGRLNVIDSYTYTGNNLAVDFPALTTVTNGAWFDAMDATSLLNMPALTTATNYMTLSATVTNPAALNFPNLASVGNLQISTGANPPPYGNLWTDLGKFSGLQSIGTLRLVGNLNLTSVALPALTTISDWIDIRYNPNLDTCDVIALYGQLTTTPPPGQGTAKNNDTTICPDWVNTP